MSPEALAPSPPHCVGPVWQKTVDGSWHLPEKSLGRGIINWLHKYVRSPGGDHAGQGFIPTFEQLRFLLWWYAVDDQGKYLYRTGVFRRMKGHGKDPLTAAMALAELCGPVAFSHFDAQGNPVGKPRHAAWVQLAAVSQEQTKNTFALFPIMVSKLLKDDYGLDVHKTIIYSSEGGRIEAVTSSPHSMEGNRPTAVFQNETQWWVETNTGHEMANVIDGNVTKIPGSRILSICNAHVPGQDSIAEKDYLAWQAVEGGQAVDVGMLYDALEAPSDTPVSEIPSLREDPVGHAEGVQRLREGLLVARGDSTWLDIDTIVKSVLDVRNSITESRRKFLNQINASEDSWISPKEWDDCWSGNLEPLRTGETITLGFDGSKSGDYTALVACRVEDGALFTIKVWNPENYPSGEVPRDDVDAHVHWCFSKYNVVAMRADIKEFEAYVDQWAAKYGRKMKIKASPQSPIAFDMRANQKKFSYDCERFLDAVLEQELVHDGNKALRSAVLNAHRHPTNWDTISIRKASKDSSRKIDAAVCAVMAFAARQEVLQTGKTGNRKVVALRA